LARAIVIKADRVLPQSLKLDAGVLVFSRGTIPEIIKAVAFDVARVEPLSDGLNSTAKIDLLTKAIVRFLNKYVERPAEKLLSEVQELQINTVSVVLERLLSQEMKGTREL
jgi:hypothetical protein